MDIETADLLRQIHEQAKDIAPTTNIHSLRAGSRQVFLTLEGDEKSGALVSQVAIKTRAGDLSGRLYEPTGKAGKILPLIIFVHGGGWSVGDLDCYDGLCTDLCMQSGVKFLSVDYRLAPETKYPGALEDVLDSIVWVRRSAISLGADPSRIAIMGDSSGGNIATVAAAHFGFSDETKLAAQFLIYPMLDVGRPHTAYPSRQQFGDGEYMLTTTNIDDALDWYCDARTNPSDPFVSPINQPKLSSLPITYMVSARFDPLYDEGVEYARRLKLAGVDVHTRTYASIHPFLSFGVLSIARHARAELAKNIADVLL